MPEMTNEQIAESLREWVRNCGPMFKSQGACCDEMLALADKLQPKPEFKDCDLVMLPDGRYASTAGWCGYSESITVMLSTGVFRNFRAVDLTPVGLDIRTAARLYHQGKLISTDGLPELPEGEEYVIVGYRAYVKDQIRGVTGCDGETVHIGRKKRATEQPSPTGETDG